MGRMPDRKSSPLHGSVRPSPAVFELELGTHSTSRSVPTLTVPKGAIPLRLPGTDRPDSRVASVGAVLASATFDRSTAIECWLKEDDSCSLAVPDATLWRHMQRLGKANAHRVEISCLPVLEVKRLSSLTEEIAEADVVHVSRTLQKSLGPWALLVTSRFTGAVRVVSSDQLPDDESVRVGYAARTLWNILNDSDSTVCLQPLPTPRQSLAGRVRRALENGLELLLGAPVLALRCTEAVVGDDGVNVLRVDESALSFIGVASGEEVVVSFGGRRTTARALAQSERHIARMTEQLGDSTGLIERAPAEHGVQEGRLLVPWFMQAWTSVAVRTRLGVPPDAVVRVRRSLLHSVQRNAVTLPLPVLSLFIAGLAIPGVAWTTWALLGGLVGVLSFFPLRRPGRPSRSGRVKGASDSGV